MEIGIRMYSYIIYYTVKNGVLQYTFGGVLQDTIMPVGVV